MQRLVLLSVLALGLSCAVALEMKFGNCPDLPSMNPFDINKYTGLWYEIERTPNPIEEGLKCMTGTVEVKDDNVFVVYRGVDEKSGEEKTYSGKGPMPDEKVPGRFKLQFNLPIPSQYWILETDYETYTVVYSCYPVYHLFYIDYAWTYSKQKTIDDATREKTYKVLDGNKIDRKHLTSMVHDCP